MNDTGLRVVSGAGDNSSGVTFQVKDEASTGCPAVTAVEILIRVRSKESFGEAGARGGTVTGLCHK